MAITDWPEGERPREKLLKNGAVSLSDAELIAIFLRVGVTGKSAVDLARDLLTQFGSLNGIFSANLADISAVHGMGESKFCQLQAIFEMSRRALSEEIIQADILNSPAKVSDYLKLKLARLKQEVFVVLFVDAQHRMIADEVLFTGTLMQTSVYPREVIKRSLQHNAASVIFAHNHPSGVAQPSEADKEITNRLIKALHLVDINVLDHFVIAGNESYSFMENGLIKQTQNL